MASPSGPPATTWIGRRSWPQRLLLTLNGGVLAVALVGASVFAYFGWKINQVERIVFGPGVLEEPEKPGEPENFLLVGSDTRAFAGDVDDGFGDASVSDGFGRSDTMIVVRVDPRARTAAMLSFPRDLLVTLPEGNQQRINVAFMDGPASLIRTITENFGIPIHHYAQVDFLGFQGVVEAVGGVTVYLPRPVRDRDANGENPTGLEILEVPADGCMELTGEQALAYVRARHFQTLGDDGRWQTDPTGDLGRIQRQQDFIKRAINEALSKDLLDPVRVNRLVNVGLDNVAISDSVAVDDVLSLGRQFRSLTPDAVTQFPLPVVDGRVTLGGRSASILRLDPDKTVEIEAIFDVFRGVQPEPEAPVHPSGITVRVLNGSGVSGQARVTTERLHALQFGTGQAGDASRTGTTTIRYGAGQEAKAALLASYVDGPTVLVSEPTLSVDLVLVLGVDFVGLLDAPLAVPPPPTVDPPPDEGDAVPPPAC